jgi:hypothetical protein
MAPNHNHVAVLPRTLEGMGSRLTRGGAFTIAQIKMAIHAQGTTMALNVNRWRIFWGEKSMKGNWMSQYKK